MGDQCYCGNSMAFEQCCGRFLTKQEWPHTPEECMRARYSAYVTHNIDFIRETQSSARRTEINWDDTEQWSKNAKWKKLEIIAAEDDWVEFIATYEMDGKEINHHERSTFILEKERWYFDDGKMIQGTIKRAGEKIGRNDPCPCGSGKKYKKCCLNK